MSIIDSIYETTGTFSIPVKDTDNYILLRDGKITSIAVISIINEMYNENLDCRILTHTLNKLISATKGLDLTGVICFEYMDKHVFTKLDFVQSLNKLNPKFLKEEYEFIRKEDCTEIKGGLYKIDEELLGSMEK